MSMEVHAAAGMEVARTALVALSEGDEPAALAAINTASEAAAKWAAAYLLTALRESVSVQVNHDQRRLGLALKRAIEGINEDIVMTQVGVILEEQARNG